MSRAVTAVLIAVSIVAAAAIGFGAYRITLKPVELPAPAAVQEHDPPRVVRSKPVPQVRPVFSLADLEGKKRSITEWDGKTLVINFWATWCPPCRREIPMLKALSAARADHGVVVIGIAIDFPEPVQAYAKEAKIDYPVLIGEQDGLDAADAFGLGAIGLPFTVFVDAQSRVVTAHLGELHAEDANLIVDAILEVNRGTLTLEQAKARIAEGVNALDQKRS